MKNECPLCGANSLIEIHGEFRMAPPPGFPGGEIVVPEASWESCAECNEIILSTELESRLDQIRYQRLGLLQPAEIRAIRERAGLTQSAMAQFVGIGEKTYTRWEAGRSLQNKSSDNLIRLADQFPELFYRIEAQRDPKRGELIQGYFESLSTLKGENELGIAAHGADLDLKLAGALRERLRVLATKKDDKE